MNRLGAASCTSARFRTNRLAGRSVTWLRLEVRAEGYGIELIAQILNRLTHFGALLCAITIVTG